MKKSFKLLICLFMFFMFNPLKVSAMRVFAVEPSGNSIELEVESSDTISAVKSKINIEEGYDVTLQNLYYNGIVLEDGRTVADYNIPENGTITLHMSHFIDIITDGNGIASSDVIRATYSKMIFLTSTPNEGYALKSVKAYKTGDKNVTVKVENLFFEMPDFDVTVEFEYDKKENLITKVEVNNAIFPSIGEVNNTKSLTVPTGANYKISSVKWVSENISDGNITEMSENEKFEEGKFYTLRITFKSDTNVFAGDLTGTINGDTAYVVKTTDGAQMEVFFGELFKYEFLDNTENQKFNKEKDKTLKFKINADPIVFDRIQVYINNKLLDSSNYIHISGEDVITLTEEYMKTLTPGTYSVKIILADGVEAKASFVVVENESQSNTNLKNPKTGDSIIIYMLLLTISVFGIIFTKRIKKVKN